MRRMGRVTAVLILASGTLCAPGAVAAERSSLVILPPLVKGGSGEAAAQADLLCDRLAERLGKVPGLAVVDRSQIERVLAERALATRPVGPMLSYDAMVRLELDASRPLPQVRLTVIDLSMGNVMGTREYPCSVAGGRVDSGARSASGPVSGSSSHPAGTGGSFLAISEGQLADMARLCVAGVQAAADRPAGRVKVRVLAPVVAEGPIRLEPLGERLKKAFEESLRRSPRVCVVQHLEAATGKEESLLLLLGLTRLPGGREFAPQADVTAEFRLTEVDPTGKTFDQTTVQLEWRVEKGAPGTWASLSGKVSEWDRVIASAWESASREVTGADPRAVEGVLGEMDLRRRQAQAELEKLRQLRALGWPCVYNLSVESAGPGRIEQIAAIASTAAKLDPTNEEAAYIDVKFNYLLRRDQARNDKNRAREILLPSVRDARRYLADFPDQPENRSEVAMAGCEAVGRMLLPQCAPGTADPLTLDVLAQMAELAVAVPSRHFPDWSWEDGRQIKMIYEAMMAAGMPTESCRQWRDRCLEAIDRRLRDPKVRAFAHHYERCLSSLRAVQIAAAMEMGAPDKARRLFADLAEAMPTLRHAYNETFLDLEQAAQRLNDGDMLARVRQWRTGGRDYSKWVQPCPVTWPADRLEVDFPDLTLEGVPIPNVLPGRTDVRVNRLWPLGIVEGRMYLLFYAYGAPPTLRPKDDPDALSGARLVSIAVDTAGRPTGDRIVPSDMPEPRRDSWIRPAGVFFGRACLGSEKCGLWVYDIKAGQWTIYAPEQGLPSWSVGLIFPLEDETILCGTSGYGGGHMYTVNLGRKQVTLLSRLEREFEPAEAVWKSGGKWLALQRNGLVEDMLSAQPGVRALRATTPQGWVRKDVLRAPGRSGSIGEPVFVAWVGQRAFASYWDTLREFNRAGELVREWPLTYWAQFAPGYVTGSLLRYYRVTVPGEVPARIVLGSDGEHLYLAGARGLVLYDAGKDQWYGPASVKGCPGSYWPLAGTVTPGGVWFSHETPTWLAKSDILTACRRKGLVFTSADLRRRLQEQTKAMPPLDQAKMAFARRRFDEARKLLDRTLAGEPGNVEALMVMGLLHERHALNQPEKALPFYEQAARVGMKPAEVLGGLMLQFQWYLNANQQDKALAIGQEMLTRFELEGNCRSYVAAAVGKLAATQPAGAAGQPGR